MFLRELISNLELLPCDLLISLNRRANVGFMRLSVGNSEQAELVSYEGCLQICGSGPEKSSFTPVKICETFNLNKIHANTCSKGYNWPTKLVKSLQTWSPKCGTKTQTATTFKSQFLDPWLASSCSDSGSLSLSVVPTSLTSVRTTSRPWSSG